MVENNKTNLKNSYDPKIRKVVSESTLTILVLVPTIKAEYVMK